MEWAIDYVREMWPNKTPAQQLIMARAIYKAFIKL